MIASPAYVNHSVSHSCYLFAMALVVGETLSLPCFEGRVGLVSEYGDETSVTRSARYGPLLAAIEHPV